MGYILLLKSGGILLFYLVSKQCENTSIIMASLDSGEQASVFGNAEIPTALFDRITHHCSMI